MEKEALAVTWACEKFATYILGKNIVIETDHRPFVILLGEKNLDKLPPRILRFHLRMSRFDYSIIHVPRKLLYTADTLSRAPTSVPDYDSQSLEEEAEAVVEVCISQPTSKSRLEVYSNSQSSDPVCQRVTEHCRNGWPNKKNFTLRFHPIGR